MTSIEVRGVNRVRNSLRRLAADTPELIDSDIRDWSQDTRKALKGTKYPAKRPGQTYVRTGRLANSFAVNREGKASYAIQNRASYAVYVIGDARGQNQAWMHEGRWWTMREEIEKRTPELVKKLTRTLMRLFDGND